MDRWRREDFVLLLIALELAEKQPVLSADFYRLLSLINYGMPQLRHLLLNSDQTFIYSDSVHDISNWGYKMSAAGNLYLPVLCRLHTFSFKSPYHADILHYSLGKFASENKRLKVRLVHMPLYYHFDELTPEKLWKEDVVISHMDYLSTINFSLNDMPKLCRLANIKYLHLHNYVIYEDSFSFLPLFTILSNSFPKLTTFSLYLFWMSPMNLVPENLPPLPKVTNLSLSWKFDGACDFGAILQPTRVFPALRRLTYDPVPCSERCSAYGVLVKHEYDFSTIQQALKPLKNYPPGALQHISINFCKRICQSKRLVLSVENL